MKKKNGNKSNRFTIRRNIWWSSMLMCTLFDDIVLMREQLYCDYAWHFNQNWCVLSNWRVACMNATGWNLVCFSDSVSFYSKFCFFPANAVTMHKLPGKFQVVKRSCEWHSPFGRHLFVVPAQLIAHFSFYFVFVWTFP